MATSSPQSLNPSGVLIHSQVPFQPIQPLLVERLNGIKMIAIAIILQIGQWLHIAQSESGTLERGWIHLSARNETSLNIRLNLLDARLSSVNQKSETTFSVHVQGEDPRVCQTLSQEKFAGLPISAACALITASKHSQSEDVVFEGNSDNLPMFGVFDGHRGLDATTYLRNYLTRHCLEHLQKKNENLSSLTDPQIYEALQEAFLSADLVYVTSPNIAQDRDGLMGGTTVTVAIILNDKIWVVQLGDSCAILYNDGEVIPLTNAASPASAKYRAQIEERGGTFSERKPNEVSSIKGNARIPFASSFGDSSQFPGVTARAEITMIPLSKLKGQCRLIFMTDGVTGTIDIPDEQSEGPKTIHIATAQDLKLAAELYPNPELLASKITDAAFYARKDLAIAQNRNEAAFQDDITTLVLDLSPLDLLRN